MTVIYFIDKTPKIINHGLKPPSIKIWQKVKFKWKITWCTRWKYWIWFRWVTSFSSIQWENKVDHLVKTLLENIQRRVKGIFVILPLVLGIFVLGRYQTLFTVISLENHIQVFNSKTQCAEIYYKFAIQAKKLFASMQWQIRHNNC